MKYIYKTYNCFLCCRSIPQRDLEHMNRIMEQDVMVHGVYDVKCVEIGNGEVRRVRDAGINFILLWEIIYFIFPCCINQGLYKVIPVIATKSYLVILFDRSYKKSYFLDIFSKKSYFLYSPPSRWNIHKKLNMQKICVLMCSLGS